MIFYDEIIVLVKYVVYCWRLVKMNFYRQLRNLLLHIPMSWWICFSILIEYLVYRKARFTSQNSMWILICFGIKKKKKFIANMGTELFLKFNEQFVLTDKKLAGIITKLKRSIIEHGRTHIYQMNYNLSRSL